MTIQTNPNINERGETFEQYQARVAGTPSVPVQDDVYVDTTEVSVPLTVDPIIGALNDQLYELEQIAIKHVLENQSNRAQVRELINQRDRNARKVEKAKIYKQELKRVNARQRLVILEFKAMKERYDSLLRSSQVSVDAARDEGYRYGYQYGYEAGYKNGHWDGQRSIGGGERSEAPGQFVDCAVDAYFQLAPFDLEEAVKSNN